MGVSFDKIDGVIWYDGKLVPWADANVHVLTHGLHYASAVFEGERAYGGRVFKSREHSERLKKSANILDFEIPYSAAEIDAAKQLVIDRNNLPDGYVRPIAWRGSEMMGVAASTNTIHLAIAAWAWPSYFDPAEKLKGIRIGHGRIQAAGSGDDPGDGEGGGSLHDLHHQQAQGGARRLCGRDDAGLAGPGRRMHRRQHLLHKDGKIHTPIADCFLAGITRATAIDLAKRRGIEVIERRIMPDELSGFTECFITGTAAEVTPVSEIADWKFTPGKISEQLMADYTAEVQPKARRKRRDLSSPSPCGTGWSTPQAGERVRGSLREHPQSRQTPHPALRATFSHKGEKESAPSWREALTSAASCDQAPDFGIGFRVKWRQ